MSRASITLETIDQINKLYKQGYRMSDVAVLTHTSLSTVARYVENPRLSSVKAIKSIKKKDAGSKYKKAETLENEGFKAENKIYSVGQKLGIIEHSRAGNDENKKIVTKGTIIYTNDRYFTIKKTKDGQDLYPTSYKYIDILVGDIKVREV
jgi:uncharacterized protein Veg